MKHPNIKLTKNYKVINNIPCRQIVARKDFYICTPDMFGIKKGELGGWISDAIGDQLNLVLDDNSWVSDSYAILDQDPNQLSTIHDSSIYKYTNNASDADVSQKKIHFIINSTIEQCSMDECELINSYVKKIRAKNSNFESSAIVSESDTLPSTIIAESTMINSKLSTKKKMSLFGSKIFNTDLEGSFIEIKNASLDRVAQGGSSLYDLLSDRSIRIQNIDNLNNLRLRETVKINGNDRNTFLRTDGSIPAFFYYTPPNDFNKNEDPWYGSVGDWHGTGREFLSKAQSLDEKDELFVVVDGKMVNVQESFSAICRDLRSVGELEHSPQETAASSEDDDPVPSKSSRTEEFNSKTTPLVKVLTHPSERQTFSNYGDPIEVYPIVAQRDSAYHGVRKGERGGYVQSKDNIGDNAWIDSKSVVFGRAIVRDYASVKGSIISKDAVVEDNARVIGSTLREGSIVVKGGALIVDSDISSLDARVCGSVYSSTIQSDAIRVFPLGTVRDSVLTQGRYIIFDDEEYLNKNN